MPSIKFMLQNASGKTHTEVITEGATGETILSAALRAQVPLEHACEGCCACATCHVIVNAGASSLSAIHEREEDMLDHAWSVTLGSRLACQARIGKSDLSVIIPCYSTNFVGEADLAQHSPALSHPPQTVSHLAGEQLRFDWPDSQLIAEALDQKHPEVEHPQWVRFTQLHEWICALEGFIGHPQHSNEGFLEAILSAWMALREG